MPASLNAPWKDPAVYIPKEVDPPNLSKAQKKRRRLGRGRARAKLHQEEEMMHVESRSNAPEDEQNPSAVSSEASSEAELEVANDYYRQIVTTRSTESQADQQASTCSSSALEEILVDLPEIELGECASSRIGVPSCNECLSTVSTTSLNILDTATRDNVVQEVAAAKWSKSQKKRLRQGKKRRVMALAKLCQQEQPQSSPPALDTRDGGKSSLVTSPTISNSHDTEAIGGVRLIDGQVERHPWAQVGRQYSGHSFPATSDSNAPERGQLTLSASRPLPEVKCISTPNLVDVDLGKSDTKLCAKASQSDGSLPSLPIEIQLQILKESVVTSGTCIELIAGQTSRQFCDHNGIALAILSTCRLYWQEGSKIFRERNIFAFRTGRACISSLKHYSRALPDLKHLTLRYTILGCSNCTMQAVADFSRIVRLMPTLKSLDVELESRWDWDSTDANNCEHYLPIEEAFKYLYGKGDHLKADQCCLRRITLSGRSWTSEMRFVTLSGEPCSDSAPILADRILPALREVRFGTSSE